jgi:hypothetical protein
VPIKVQFRDLTKVGHKIEALACAR